MLNHQNWQIFEELSRIWPYHMPGRSVLDEQSKRYASIGYINEKLGLNSNHALQRGQVVAARRRALVVVFIKNMLFEIIAFVVFECL